MLIANYSIDYQMIKTKNSSFYSSLFIKFGINNYLHHVSGHFKLLLICHKNLAALIPLTLTYKLYL